MRLRDLLRSRLALRIYLVGLAQFAVISAGFFTLMLVDGPRIRAPHDDGPRFIAGLVTRALGDRAALDALLATADDLGTTVTVLDENDTIVVTNADPGTPRCLHHGNGPPSGPPPHLPGLPPLKWLRDGGPPPCRVTPLRLADGRPGKIEIVSPGHFPPPPPLSGWRVIAVVLVVVGVSSWLLARTLTKPLGRLSSAAQALGKGDLKARAALPNRDELGDVSRAFDEMAERVAELLRAEKELLANVSHELRTPLARIRMALALASESEGDAAALRESITDITGDLDELERLITDILTAARLALDDVSAPAGVPPLRRQWLDTGDMLAHAASRFRASHPKRTLDVKLSDDLPPVDGDPVLLRRVVDNLLENAHKYTTRAEAPIALVAKGQGDDVVIEVIDKGIGIAAADLPRVFRPFFRADRSRTRATGGLGLGLALSKRIVDAHGGRIELTSAPNEGTCARVILPVTHGRDHESDEAVPSDPESETHREIIV